MDGLDELVGRQVLIEQTQQYRFRHELLRTAVYDALSYGRRQLLHRRAGNVLEELQPDNLVVLARHFERAGAERADKAVAYLIKAGDQARELSAYHEAIDYYQRALALLETLPITPQHVEQELRCQTALGPMLMATQGIAAPDVEKTYARARELCQTVSASPQLFPVLWGLSAFYLVRAELQTARELAERCLSLAQSVQDEGLLLEAHRIQGLTLFHLGELAPARMHLEQGVTLYDPHQHHAHAFLHGGGDPGVTCLSYGALALWSLGYPDQALQRSHEALTLAEELSHPYSQVYALTHAATLHIGLRDWQTVRDLAEVAMTTSTERGFAQWVAVATIHRGWLLTEQGRHEEGITQMRQGLSVLQTIGVALGRSSFLGLLAGAYGKVGQVEEGLSVLAEALEEVHRTEHRVDEAELYRLRGELLLMQGAGSLAPTDEAETCFRQAIEVARQQQARSLELRAVMSLGRLLQQQRPERVEGQDKREEASRILSEIYGWFTEGFDTPDLKEAKALLEELS